MQFNGQIGEWKAELSGEVSGERDPGRIPRRCPGPSTLLLEPTRGHGHLEGHPPFHVCHPAALPDLSPTQTSPSITAHPWGLHLPLSRCRPLLFSAELPPTTHPLHPSPWPSPCKEILKEAQRFKSKQLLSTNTSFFAKCSHFCYYDYSSSDLCKVGISPLYCR